MAKRSFVRDWAIATAIGTAFIAVATCSADDVLFSIPFSTFGSWVFLKLWPV